MLPRRVVTDSNVLISALHWGGKPAAVIDLAHAGEIALYLSPFILEEVHDILAVKLGWHPLRVRSALASLPATVVGPGAPRLNIVSDWADNRIVECAVAARARYLVTGDRGLLTVGAYRRIQILTPADFLSLL
mgnify:CR=1 FL=1